MKKANLSIWLLIMLSVVACKSDDAPSAEALLAGNWSGDIQITKAGDCELVGGEPTKLDATWQVSGAQVTGQLSMMVGTTTVTTQMNGTLDGNTIRLSQTSRAQCNNIRREYETWFEGKINGKNLTLVARDTVCPAMNCVFLRTIRLTKQ